MILAIHDVYQHRLYGISGFFVAIVLQLCFTFIVENVFIFFYKKNERICRKLINFTLHYYPLHTLANYGYNTNYE